MVIIGSNLIIRILIAAHKSTHEPPSSVFFLKSRVQGEVPRTSRKIPDKSSPKLFAGRSPQRLPKGRRSVPGVFGLAADAGPRVGSCKKGLAPPRNRI